MVRGIGGTCQQGKPLLTKVIKNGQVIPLKTREAPEGLFDPPEKGGAEILLCAQHCAELKIDMNHALSKLEP